MGRSSAPPLVLVADDEPQMRELVVNHLRQLDEPRLDVLEASDGEEAWELAREHLPDLVVLDVMMPGMSGWEVCRKIRDDIALAHTGVLMLTGIGENLNQMTSPLYGADAYIDKPFDFGELDEKVREALLSRARQRDAVARPVRNGVGGHVRPAVTPASPAVSTGEGRVSKRTEKKRGAKSAPKGRSTMAAKKTAKKAAAKKTAKKAAAKKTTAKKTAVKKTAKKAAKKRAAKKTAK